MTRVILKMNFSVIFNMGPCANENAKYLSIYYKIRRDIEYFHVSLRDDLFSKDIRFVLE